MSKSTERSQDSRDLFDALINRLLQTPYSGDGHYLLLDAETMPRATKITDYMVSQLRLCEGILPSQGLRKHALSLGQPFITIECEATANAYSLAIPETLRPDGLVSGSLLDHIPPDWPEGEPVVWRIKTAGNLGATALEQPFEDPVLLRVYQNLLGQSA